MSPKRFLIAINTKRKIHTSGECEVAVLGNPGPYKGRDTFVSEPQKKKALGGNAHFFQSLRDVNVRDYRLGEIFAPEKHRLSPRKTNNLMARSAAPAGQCAGNHRNRALTRKHAAAELPRLRRKRHTRRPHLVEE